MSHPQTQAAKTFEAVERARHDVNGLKTHVSQLMRSEAPADQNMARSLAKHMQKAETLVEQAEKTVTRIKNVRVPPRPTASVPRAMRAKRALSVLLSGLDSDDILHDLQNRTDGATDKTVENVLDKPGFNSEPEKKRPKSFLSAAGKPIATPMREEDLKATLGKVNKETGLAVLRNVNDFGVVFECPNVFRALVWFKDVDAPTGAKPMSDGSTPKYIVPEHIAVFGVDESNACRWACSRYAVFKVITERANAAVRYFTAREKTGEDAFLALANWLARHKTMFSTKCEDRRLAFDASRGIFLPACIYSFEGQGPPRFTRGSIPLRNNPSYTAQPNNVRVPPSGNHVPSNQSSQPGQGSVSAGGGSSVAASAVTPAAIPLPSGSHDSSHAMRNSIPSQPNTAPGGTNRMSQVDLRALSSRSRG